MVDLELLSDKAQEYFDSYVAEGTDDQLFASGYLRGHVDLVIGTAIVQEETITLESLVDDVEKSVNKAIKNGELEQNDIVTVNDMLNRLIKHLAG
ncbi:YfcL family protein [Psychrosphaera haliotis]|uniref:YfcL family protein n=1 Tax=Psychrosphaera haliotis TaxID=555083 RepID=A0A6N8F9Y6_9GAMM|nr:YfcL family protein [Psychrosphaera haliotis]MUH72279.1 YfcL family protein [Psychrosphaera haliotis]